MKLTAVLVPAALAALAAVFMFLHRGRPASNHSGAPPSTPNALVLLKKPAPGATEEPKSAAPGQVSPLDDPPEFHVPHVAEKVIIDGEYKDKRIWQTVAVRTPIFLAANGKGMVPYSDARLAWGNGRLYVLFYAGDLDIQASATAAGSDLSREDSLHLEFFRGPELFTLDVSPLKTFSGQRCNRRADPPACTPWDSRMEVGVDIDGTPNQLGDFDEEWVLELAIPLAAMGISDAPGARFALGMRRCDVSHDGMHACGTWGMSPLHATLILDGPAEGGGKDAGAPH